MEKAEKKQIAVFLGLLAIVIVILVFVDKKKDKEREAAKYIDGIRAEVYGGTPEENEMIRRQMVNKILNGENGLNFQQSQALQKQFERDRQRQAASMGN